VRLIRGELETPAHVTAIELHQDLEALVTYDSRLAAAAGRQQLPVVTP
jgi:hypothetical protein